MRGFKKGHSFVGKLNALSNDDCQDNKENATLSLVFNGIHFDSEISKDSIDEFLYQLENTNYNLLLFESSHEALNLYQIPTVVWLSSPGGDVDQSLRVINYVTYSPRPIVFVSSSLVASAATYIYLSTPREYRYTTPFSYFLFHDFLINHPYYTGSKDIVSNLESTYKILKEIFEDEILKKTGMKKKIIGKGAHKDLFVSAKKAIEFGVAKAFFKNLDELHKEFSLDYKELMREYLVFVRNNNGVS